MRKPISAVVSVAAVLVVGATALARTGVDRTHPDTADRTTLITLRNAVHGDALRTLRTIGRCERGVRDPYGSDRQAFNQCVLIRLNQDLYTSRFEPAMLIGVLRDLAPGPCAVLASGVGEGISELGNEAQIWIGDAESPDPSAAALERADAHDMRSIAHGIVKLAIDRRWRTACSARPYQPSEHHTLRVALVFTA